MSIVEALIGQVQLEIDKSGHSGPAVAVNLSIGRLSGVHEECLRFAFEVLSPGTVVEGAQLRIEQPKAVVVCADCGSRQPIDQLVVSCPGCGSGRISIEGGQDLQLDSIELADTSETS